MRRVFVQIVDTLTGISQTGTIEEPVKNGLEITNAIAHFVGISSIDWMEDFIHKDLENEPRILTGVIDGTNKIVNVVYVGLVVTTL